MNNGCDIVSMSVDCKMHADLASHPFLYPPSCLP